MIHLYLADKLVLNKSSNVDASIGKDEWYVFVWQNYYNGKLTVREEDGGKANCERRRWYEGLPIMKTNFDHQKKRKSPRGKSSNF